MLAKLKRPECYIGHGVFVFPEGYDYPVKRKITDIHVRYSENGWVVLDVVIERYHDWLQPTDVYMSKKEARHACWKKKLDELKKERRHLEMIQKDILRGFELYNQKVMRLCQECKHYRWKLYDSGGELVVSARCQLRKDGKQECSLECFVPKDEGKDG